MSSDFQVFDIALAGMQSQHQQLRESAMHIARTNLPGAQNAQPFSQSMNAMAVDSTTGQQGLTPSGGPGTVDDMVTILRAGRLYEANTSVISAARSAFEKALEISGRRT